MGRLLPNTLPPPGARPCPADPRTPRLVAERPDLGAHLDFAALLFADRQVAATLWPAHLGGPRTGAQTRSVFDRDLDHWERHGFGQWWWRLAAGGELVARGGLQWTMVGGEASIEVGWAVLPEHWNEGIATELASASLSVGFDYLGLDSIVAYTLVTNGPSRRVMEKSGLAYEREVRHLDLPHVVYRMRAPAHRGAEAAANGAAARG
jgi:[ribosomal protein S5]-alanine N-acetyltransferase